MTAYKSTIAWLTPELKLKTKILFEKRYGRELSKDEVSSIAIGLAAFTETIARSGISIKNHENGKTE